MEENKNNPQNNNPPITEPLEKSETDILKEQISKLEKEKDEYLNGWKRAKADSINQQKDELKRMEEIMKFANTDIIKDLLLVLDSFAALEKNFRSEPRSKELERELDGVLIIKDQLEKILNKHGLEKIKALGEIFDPSLHEAMLQEASDKESGTILEEMVKGWKLNGKVIRPTKVKIAK
ncbi:MAG: nucleotide exchange factor GrpE [Minisyncoccota bacterium]